jgi:hypothetical protein
MKVLFLLRELLNLLINGYLVIVRNRFRQRMNRSLDLAKLTQKTWTLFHPVQLSQTIHVLLKFFL